MKRIIACIFVFVLILPDVVWSTPPDISSLSPKILIINSYNTELVWANNIVKGVEKELLDRYPYAKIYSKNLGINSTIRSNMLQYSLRSALWALAEHSAGEDRAQDTNLVTAFSSGVFPDVIVMVGDGGFLFYQSYGPIMNGWEKVPMVLCGVSDFVCEDDYLHDYENLISIEERRQADSFVFSSSLQWTDPKLKRVKSNEGGASGYYVTQHYNFTGVKSSLPVKQNLEMINRLIPELQEIIWVDDEYYDSGYAQWLVENEIDNIMPEVKFTSIVHNRFNSDSIYNEMLKADEGKAYLTYSWNINGIYSRYSKDYIRLLFDRESSVPVFSLTEPSFSGNYWIGGVYRPTSEWIGKTIKQIERVLQGEQANDIPFEFVAGEAIKLDQMLLNKYNLSRKAHVELENVEYMNIPPTFYEENERWILGSIVLVTFLLGALLHVINRNKQNKITQKERDRLKKLYAKLQMIYKHTSVDFALYNKLGDCIIRVRNGKKQRNKDANDPFSENLFENPYLANEQLDCIRNQESINMEMESMPYQLIINPFDKADDRDAWYMVLTVDLSELIQEREEKEQFKKLLAFASDSSQIGMAFYDLNTGNITATQSWFKNMNEPKIPDALPSYTNVMAGDRKSLLNFRKQVMNGRTEPFLQDIQVCDDDDNLYWVREHIYVNEKDENMLIELNLNINGLKKSEEKLRFAKEMAEQSNIETQQFLNSINHEIRTPLNSIVGYSTLLSITEDEEEMNEYIPTILRNNKLLTILIDDIIELSKVDSGQIDFACDPVNVADLFKKMKEHGYLRLYNKQLAVVADIPEENPVVYTDGTYLQRLFMNLFSNAVKFTDSGTITLGYHKNDESYYFYVKDTGCGISKENQHRIFKRFDKLDSFSQGTGLGLPLCKSIVSHLNGEIGVTSEIGKGSTFWFIIPVPPNG